MIRVTVKIETPPEKREDVLLTLRSLLGPTTASPGCKCSLVYLDANNENRLMLWEVWTSRKELEKHVRSDNYRRLLAVMDISVSRPDICFITMGETEGMEYITRLRESIQ